MVFEFFNKKNNHYNIQPNVWLRYAIALKSPVKSQKRCNYALLEVSPEFLCFVFILSIAFCLFICHFLCFVLLLLLLLLLFFFIFIIVFFCIIFINCLFFGGWGGGGGVISQTWKEIVVVLLYNT